jgi:hypothetical protein
MVFDQSRATSSTCFSFVALHPQSQVAMAAAANNDVQSRKWRCCDGPVSLRPIIGHNGFLSLLFVLISQALMRGHAGRDFECSKNITPLMPAIFQKFC